MASAFSPAGNPALRGATGTRVPHGQPGGRLSSGPRRPAPASSRAPLRALRDLVGSPGPPCGARVAAICVPLQAAAFRMVWTFEGQTPQARSAMCLSAASGSAPLPTLCRKRSQRASWILSHLALLPGAGRLHMGDGWRHPRPVATNDGPNLMPPGRPEIRTAALAPIFCD